MQNKENKNIDQLFKDRLQGMESTPPPVVWENIQEALGHKKKDRKVIPLWWKLGGIAAALVLLFSVANMLMTDNLNGIIDTDNNIVKETSEDKIQLNDTPNTLDETKENNTTIINPLITKSTEESGVATHTNNKEAKDSKNTKAEIINNTVIKNHPSNNNAIVANTVLNNNLNQQESSNSIHKELLAKNTIVANDKVNPTNNNIVSNDGESSIYNDDKTNNNVINANPVKEAVANEDSNKADNFKNTTNEDHLLKENTKSIFDAIDEQKEAVAKTTDENPPLKRWAISPNVAPVYYSSLSEGSSIDPTFSDNTQNGEVNVSYGINVSYAISSRLSVRSGVSNVNLSYATGGLELATGDSSAALQSIIYNNTGSVITAVDQGVLDIAQTEGSPYANLRRKATEGDVFLTQSITYTEIPAELTYKLVNKRFGLNVIGGFSTLLLGNNEVSVSASDFNDVLGEANNLSNISFSTNIGLGASYQVSEKFTFNVEPMFKYQLNPYTDNTVQFRPYYVGVYSGLSFKF